MKQVTNKTLASVIDKEREFTFRSYSYTPPGIIALNLYGDHNREILLSQRDNLEHLAVAMALVVAPACCPPS